jgi:secreted trypsin-like serine protease
LDRIVGGEATGKPLPYQVSIRTTYNFHYCGGTIVGRKHILSAAHCFTGDWTGEKIVAGAYTSYNNNEDNNNNKEQVYQ